MKDSTLNATIIFIAALCSMSFTTWAQSDSVTTSVFEEPSQTSDFKKRERYKYLKRSMIEEKSMFKISGFPSWGGYAGLGLKGVISYEKKLTPSFSVSGALVNRFGASRTSTIYYQDTIYQFKSSSFWQTSLDFSVRYYYGMKKEIKSGRGGNNLLSNYFELRVGDLLSYRIASVNSKFDFVVKPNVILAWGLQRRIGRYGYFDASIGVGQSSLRSLGYNVGIGSQKQTIGFYPKLALGIGLSRKNVGRKR